MAQTSPTSRLIAITSVFTLLLVITFVGFSLSGMQLQHSPLLIRNYSEVTYDGEEGRAPAAPVPPSGPPDLDRRPLPESWTRQRPVGVPETVAEESYFSAVRRIDERVQEMADRLKEKEQVREFLDQPLGKELTLISAIAKRGRTDEAYQRLKGVLTQLHEQDFAVQAFVMKFAIRLFSQQGDKAGLRDAVVQYLEKSLQHLETPEGEKEAGAMKPDLVRRVQALLSEAKGQ